MQHLAPTSQVAMRQPQLSPSQADGWVGVAGLSNDQLHRQIAAAEAKLNLLKAEFAARNGKIFS